MNFRAMIDRVKYTLGMQEIVSHDETAFIKAYLNEGVIDILVRCRPYTRVINLSLTPGTAIHDMSSDILALLDINDPDYGFLERFTREDITTMQKQGGAGFAYEEPLLWLSPIPTGAKQVQAYGIFRPASMASDTDDASLQNFGSLAPEFHPAVLNYACWRGGEYTQHEASASGEKWRVQYEGRDGTEGDIARIKRILNKRVTPQASRRRDLTGNLGSLSASGEYIGG